MGVLVSLALGGAVGYAFTNGLRNQRRDDLFLATWDFILAAFFVGGSVAWVMGA